MSNITRYKTTTTSKGFKVVITDYLLDSFVVVSFIWVVLYSVVESGYYVSNCPCGYAHHLCHFAWIIAIVQQTFSEHISCIYHLCHLRFRFYCSHIYLALLGYYINYICIYFFLFHRTKIKPMCYKGGCPHSHRYIYI